MQKIKLILTAFFALTLLLSESVIAQTTVTIGAGTSSSSSRGPFQRSDAGSSSVYSRSNQVYTQAELNAVGINGGEQIAQLNWWNQSGGNIIDATGDAFLTIYMRNTSNADATVDSTWANALLGSSLVGSYTFNTTNNFPTTNGWQEFILDSPFIYTGGSVEIAVEWDCSGLTSTNADPNLLFTGNGALKFRYEATSNVSLAVRAGGSSAPSGWATSSHFKSERSNIQITYNLVGCQGPSGIAASNITATSADLSWNTAADATTYTYKVVASGAGSGATAIATGTVASLTASASGLTAFTGYDLYVRSNCGASGPSSFEGPHAFFTLSDNTGDVTVGTGTSSSSSRGPIQRSDVASSTIYSRWHHIYTAAELAAAGLECGASLTALNWELASANVMIGTGDATFKVYIKNSAATAAVGDSWTNLIAGSDQVVDRTFNTSNNFPGANGWMPFDFSSPFVYDGGALEISVDWDCSQVSTPAFSGDGSLKWRWQSTAPDALVAKRTGSSSAPSTISDLLLDRSNIQFVFNIDGAIDGNVGCPDDCLMPDGLASSNPTETMADLAWNSSSNAVTYTWIVVAEGAGSTGTAVASGGTSTTTAMATGLTAATGYDFYVEANCGAGETSGCAGPLTFFTLAADVDTVQVGFGTTGSSTRGPMQRADTLSNTVFSRWHFVYTQEDLAAAGLECGASMTGLNWEKGNSNSINGPGDATWKVYIKNSTATTAVGDTWSNLISGSDLKIDRVFNMTDNFPAETGWMPFNFAVPFVYDGGALEISVDWDGSQLATPGDAADNATGFDGNGAVTWRWESTGLNFHTLFKRSSTSAPSTIDDLDDERANIQFVFNVDDAIDGNVACAGCPEDINSDGTVDINDFLALNSVFGSSCTCAADINGDGEVDVNDFLAFNSAFGTDCD